MRTFLCVLFCFVFKSGPPPTPALSNTLTQTTKNTKHKKTELRAKLTRLTADEAAAREAAANLRSEKELLARQVTYDYGPDGAWLGLIGTCLDASSASQFSYRACMFDRAYQVCVLCVVCVLCFLCVFVSCFLFEIKLTLPCNETTKQRRSTRTAGTRPTSASGRASPRATRTPSLTAATGATRRPRAR